MRKEGGRARERERKRIKEEQEEIGKGNDGDCTKREFLSSRPHSLFVPAFCRFFVK